MAIRITRISSSGFARVNSYLLEQNGAFVLVDTGFPGGRKPLIAALQDAWCAPGDLRLIVITHADPDHVGSAAFLRKHYHAPIAMHRAEAGVVSGGEPFTNRVTRPGPLVKALFKALGLVFRADRFAPDVLLDEAFDLGTYGIEARVLELPGHSIGSIALLTADGDLFCGDLLENRGTPRAGSIVDVAATRDASIARVRALDARTVYPGHGEPFAMSELPG